VLHANLIECRYILTSTKMCHFLAIPGDR